MFNRPIFQAAMAFQEAAIHLPTRANYPWHRRATSRPAADGRAETGRRAPVKSAAEIGIVDSGWHLET